MTMARKGSADKTIPHTRLEEEGMVWDTYECGRKLGQGAFGKVFHVTHKSTNIEWAMKTVNKEKAGSSAIKLLEREVAILKRVSHPNIIQLNEVFETSKRMFLIMELCEGGELADALKERKYFMESEVKVITKELASAIAYLHKNDIVHRDIKLENILISKFPDATDPEDKLDIKVTDFGLSIEKSGVGHDNMMQDFCGTPNYMAPEIIDNKTYSQQCDVWALGVIVYTLFCGYPPFRSKDEDSLYEMIKKGELDFTTDDVWKEVSNEAKLCIKDMLNVDPANRLTASEVVHHHWITGNVENQSTNVLQLMKEWKNDLQDDLSDTEDSEDKEKDKSAINGECVPTVEITDTTETGQETTKYVDQNHTEEPKEAESSRKGSGGTKKPGSGGKSSGRQGRNSLGSIPRTTTGPTSLKPTSTMSKGTKSPQPPSRGVTPANITTASRPHTQNNVRASAANNNNKTHTKNMTSIKPTSKVIPTKK